MLNLHTLRRTVPAVLCILCLILPLPVGGADDPPTVDEALMTARREKMVQQQIRERGVSDPQVLAALGRVPRHRFVMPGFLGEAYRDHPLPIGEGQTISQPYIVAYMTELLHLEPHSRVLEIGTGSGYQAAVLAEICAEVYSIEIIEPLGRRGEKLLAVLGYENVQVRIGDGYRGWPEQAPFDGIIVTAAPGHVPQPLLEQLAEGGRLVIPVGTGYQRLEVHRKLVDSSSGKVTWERETKIPVRFVPMTGEARGD
jgi:protein-L-isoaspartate(D-aspartate) O-methyltransferase